MVIKNETYNFYNRILLGVAALGMARAGVTLHMIGLFLAFMEKAKHHVMLGSSHQGSLCTQKIYQ